jgi:xanthine/uracil permease
VVIQTLLFVAGINTLLQSFFGTRLPAVLVDHTRLFCLLVYVNLMKITLYFLKKFLNKVL